MAYHMSGVLVERSQQSMRPREPAPPGRSITISSRLMSTRMLRPRENNAINGYGLGAVARVPAKAAADMYLNLIAAHRKQQRYLEDLLKQIGVEMKKAQGQVTALSLSKDPKGLLPGLRARLLQLQRDANACISAIKACASKANASAAAATENGATPVEVQQANTSAGTSSGSANIDTVTADVSPTDSAVETNTPSVAPDGTLVPGSDAKVVETPAVTEPGSPTPTVTPPSGSGLSLGGIAVGIGVIWAGGKLLKFW